MKKFITLTLLLVSLVVTKNIFATDYYVSALIGNDSYAGTFAQPFANIRKAYTLQKLEILTLFPRPVLLVPRRLIFQMFITLM